MGIVSGRLGSFIVLGGGCNGSQGAGEWGGVFGCGTSGSRTSGDLQRGWRG